MKINEDGERIRRELERQYESKVQIALFGQPGAGKSSLINKLAGRKLAEVGVETDKTVDAQSYEFNGLVFVDLPGYGTSRFPKDSYWGQFDLDRFDLFLCVTSGKLHQADTELFQELRRRGKVCIYVVNKSDEMWEEGCSFEELRARRQADIEKHVGEIREIVFTSCRDNSGIDSLTLLISDALGEAKSERWQRSAQAYSDDFLALKRRACERLVGLAAGSSALNALNPIPGADVAVDVGVLVTLFSEIRDAYGLTAEKLSTAKNSSVKVLVPLANRVIEYAAKDGAILLLKRFAGRQIAKTASKYIPFVGTIVAGALGYGITVAAGNSYLEDCHELASAILREQLKRP